MSLPVRTASPTNKYLDVGERDTDTADDSKLEKYTYIYFHTFTKEADKNSLHYGNVDILYFTPIM